MQEIFYNTINGIDLKYNPECYLESISAILKYNRYEGDALISHLGFIFQPPSDNNLICFDIKASYIKEIQYSIYELANVKIFTKNSYNWEFFKNKINDSINQRQPIATFIDTFFVPYFDKKRGHTWHLWVIYAIANDLKYIKMKSSLPGDWEMPLCDLRMAYKSKGQSLTLDYNWIEFNYSNKKKINIYDIFQRNLLFLEKESSKEGCYINYTGLEKFLSHFKNWMNDLDSNTCFIMLEEIYKQLRFVVVQRKRYYEFLVKFVPDACGSKYEIINIYKGIATNWEIFRNICYKTVLHKDYDLRKGAIIRLSKIIELEKQGFKKLKLLQLTF